MTHYFARLCVPALLILCVPACLAPEHYVENRCSATPTFERFGAQAALAAGEPYVEHLPVACSEVDRPPDGNKAAEGLVFEEYAAITAGSAGNFLDDNTWWVKALPHGEIHQLDLLLNDEACAPVNYDQFSYDYSAATPPILEPPSCAKGLSALQVGHSFFQTSPQVLELEATAYARLASLSLNPVFGSTLRFATENATQRTESFPYLRQLELTGHDPKSLSFVAQLSGVTFEAVLEAELVPAANSRLQVRLRIYPRAGADPGVSLGVAAVSSMFWKHDADTPDVAADEAHDADQLYVRSTDNTETITPLENPKLSLASDPWQRKTFAGPFDTISLLQTERDPQAYAAYESARYADRPSYTIDEITASVPLSAELAIVHASDEYIDNVVLDLTADTNGAAVPIEVSYVLTAEAN